MKKRIISMLLALVMVVGMLPLAIFNVGAIGLADFYTTIRIGDDVYDVDTMPGNLSGDGYSITSTGPTELVIKLKNYNGGPIYVESSNPLISGQLVFPKIEVMGECVINVPSGYEGYGIEYYSLHGTPYMVIEFDDLFTDTHGDAGLTIQGSGTGAVKVSGHGTTQGDPTLDLTGPVGSAFTVNMSSGEGVVVCNSNENYTLNDGIIHLDSDIKTRIVVPSDQYAVHATNLAFMGKFITHPEIHSVTVNGTNVDDGDAFSVESGNVTIKTTYDNEQTQYGPAQHYASYYLNGEKINVAKITPVDNGNGTSTKTYSRTLNPGDELKVESWLEVTVLGDGSKQTVDERTTNVFCIDADFDSLNPTPTASELINKYTDLGTMKLGSADTNIDFKAFPKGLSAAAISDGWTTGRSISVTRDGVEIYNKTYASNELFGWNLKDNIDEGGTYLITLRVFAQKGERIVEKTHKYRVFVNGSTIKTVVLDGVATPIIGKSPSTIATVKSNTTGVVVKKVIWNYWSSEMGGSWLNMSSGSKFESGKRYAVEIELQTADGYSFTANKSDMTVYINGVKASNSINYSSSEFAADLEFEAITTPEFTTQPKGGNVAYGEKMTVNWATNFTPCKIIVGEYNSYSQVVNQVEYSNTTTSVDLPANEYGYVVIAYYNDANAKYSSKITITETAPAFTMQPMGGEVASSEKLDVSWATNFTPKKLQVLKYSQGYCTGSQNLDVNATTANVNAGGEYYIIRAYYSDSNYVDSNKFYVTEVVAPSYVLGDINGDDEVNATDYILAKRGVMGTYTLSETQILAGDINGDDTITATDYIFLKRAVMGTYTIG